MLERAVKAEEKAKEKKALKEATKLPEKKKITTAPLKAVTATKALVKKDTDEREKALAKREKELLKKEKMMQMKQETSEDTTDSDDY
jgi:hypothetical protein